MNKLFIYKDSIDTYYDTYFVFRKIYYIRNFYVIDNDNDNYYSYVVISETSQLGL